MYGRMERLAAWRIKNVPYLRQRTEENLMADKTFIKITNKDVYKEIQALRADVNHALTAAKINAAIISVIISVIGIVLSRIL